MPNRFSQAPWWNSQKRGTGFVPGPIQVPIVNQGAVTPPPPPQPAPKGRVPMGKKTDCPICRKFGK